MGSPIQGSANSYVATAMNDNIYPNILYLGLYTIGILSFNSYSFKSDTTNSKYTLSIPSIKISFNEQKLCACFRSFDASHENYHSYSISSIIS